MGVSEEVNIPIRVQGAAKAKKDIEDIGKKGKKAEKGVKKLTSALKVLASAVVVRQIIGLGVEFQQLDRKMRSVSDGAEDLRKNMDLVVKVSRETRSNISSNASAFQRLSIATSRLGVSADSTAQILKTLNQAFAVGGASTSEQAAAMTQLGQALASGKLNGDELRSLTENASFLADVLGDKLGGEGIASLRALSKEGKLTSDVLVKALLEVGEDIDDRYSKLPKTIGEAMQNLKTEMTLLGEQLIPIITSMTDVLTLLGEVARNVSRDIERINLKDELRVVGNLTDKKSFRRASQIRGRLRELDPNAQRADRALGGKFGVKTVQENREKQEDPETRDLSQDPVLAALRARQEEEQSITKEHLAKINQLSQEQFEKDMERHEAQKAALTAVFNVAGDALLEFTRTGEFNFKEFGSAILETLQEILLQALITQAVTALLGGGPSAGGGDGGGIAGLGAQGIPLLAEFAGGRAEGGTFSAGQFGVVGERGPEMIMGPATVIPNGGAGGGGGPIEIIVRDETGRVLDIMRSEGGQRAQLDNMNAKRSQTKRLLA